MVKKIYEMTSEGIKELQDELEKRKTTISLEIAERLKEARAQGDLSENSEYDDAKENQTKNEIRIAEIESILQNARAIHSEEISKSKVTLGSVVEILDVELADKQTYTVVSPHEEDITRNKISNESPVGIAILGHKKGELVDVTTPSGVIQYKILNIGK